MRSFSIGPGCELVIREADITTLALDAIVNAANERMLGGGGVDGAIHRAAGPELLDACRAVAEVRPGVRCPTGEARITPGFRLPAKHVIHTVGPVYRDATVSAPLLRGAYRSSLELAREHGLSSVAFPAISCGVFGYPLDEAADVALRTIAGTLTEQAGSLSSVQMALFGRESYDAFVAAAERIFAGEQA